MGINESKKEGRKEMFYITTHSAHFIYGYMVKDHTASDGSSDRSLMNPLNYFSFQPVVHDWCNKEGNVLFSDELNTFYLRLYGVGHMVKDHSDRERGNPLPSHGILFPINSKGSFICMIQSWITGWNEK